MVRAMAGGNPGDIRAVVDCVSDGGEPDDSNGSEIAGAAAWAERSTGYTAVFIGKGQQGPWCGIGMVAQVPVLKIESDAQAKSPDTSKVAAKSGKILLLASNFPPVLGGSAVVYENLARHAAGRIVVVAPIVNYADGKELAGRKEFDEAAPYRIKRYPLLRTRLRKGETPMWGVPRVAALLGDLVLRATLSGRLLRLVATERATTVCVGELLASGWMLALLRWVPFVRTIVYVHGEELTTVSHWDPDLRRARRALQLADRVIVVSRFTEAVARRLLGPVEGKAKLALIPNGVDRQRFRPLPRRAELVERYGLADRFVYISVCRLVEKKGVDHTICALALLLPSAPDAMLLVVGAGPFEPALRELAEAQRRGRPRRVRRGCVRRHARRSLLPWRCFRDAEPQAPRWRHRRLRPGVPGGECLRTPR